MGRALAIALAFLLSLPAAAKPIRRWSQIEKLSMGISRTSLRKRLSGATLRTRSLKFGQQEARERVIFEGHTPARVTYRFFRNRLFEVDLQYLKRGRTEKMLRLLTQKFGKRWKRIRGGRAWRLTGQRGIKYLTPRGRVRVRLFDRRIYKAYLAAARGKRVTPPERAAAEQGHPDKREIEERERADRARRAREEEERRYAGVPRRARIQPSVLSKRDEDPELWDSLGIAKGPARVLSLPAAGNGRLVVVTGFRRLNGPPLVATLRRAGGGIKVLYLGKLCAGEVLGAEAVDMLMNGHPDVALYLKRHDTRVVALVPSETGKGRAKFIGGSLAGKNAYACFPLSGSPRSEGLIAIDFVDADHDTTPDLRVSYGSDVLGPAHDIYFFQGADFYFRETRAGLAVSRE